MKVDFIVGLCDILSYITQHIQYGLTIEIRRRDITSLVQH